MKNNKPLLLILLLALIVALVMLSSKNIQVKIEISTFTPQSEIVNNKIK